MERCLGVLKYGVNARQLECYDTKDFASTGRRSDTGRRGVLVTAASDRNRAFCFSASVDELPPDLGRI